MLKADILATTKIELIVDQNHFKYSIESIYEIRSAFDTAQNNTEIINTIFIRIAHEIYDTGAAI